MRSRKFIFVHSFYLDPLGLFGGLDLWWDDGLNVEIYRLQKISFMSLLMLVVSPGSALFLSFMVLLVLQIEQFFGKIFVL